MNLQSLKPAKGSTHNSKRIGRGQGSGKGGTSTRGHKGAKSRSGNKTKIGFEGGQMPLQRRLPKFGFTNLNRVEYVGINLDTIQALIDTNKLSENISKDDIINNKLASKKDLIKILGRGELKSKVSIKADKFTKTAEQSILKLGGSVEVIEKKVVKIEKKK